jgi:epoxyqueuosine reductase
MPDDLASRLKVEAIRLGFDRVGIAPAVTPPGYGHYQDWLRDGCEAGMAYMRTREDARAHPDSILPGVRSIVVAAMIYGESTAPSNDPRRGKVARYARGADYHDVLWKKLNALLAWLKAERPGTRGRAVADTAPLLERDFAQLAGLGWIGKNTMLIDRKIGSFTVLGSLLVDLELDYDAPHSTDHCGTCTRCLDACPTEAFDGPNRLDAGKCLSYWTIEHRGPIPAEVAADLDGWAFGCDICQDVCPWNRKAPSGREPALVGGPEWTDPDLIAWLEMDTEEFRRKIKGTALARAKRVGLIRNAALILGNRLVIEAAPALRRLLDDADEGVREAAAWALSRIEDSVQGPG